MKRTYTGSCHCGAVHIEAELDLAAGTGKCNCSICTKMRLWGVKAKPDAFRLVAGENALADYQFNSGSVHHLFCRHCGVRAFEWADIPELGGKTYTVNVACLDGVDVDELVNAPITYYDGRNNNWWNKPAEVRHL